MGGRTVSVFAFVVAVMTVNQASAPAPASQQAAIRASAPAVETPAVGAMAALTARDLVALTPAVRAFQAEGASAEPPPTKLAGRQFVLRVPVSQSRGSKCSVEGNSFYDASSQTLMVSFGGIPFRDSDYDGSLPKKKRVGRSIMLSCAEKNMGMRPALDESGHPMAVLRSFRTTTEIAQTRWTDTLLEYFVRTSPDEAKRLTGSLIIEVEGHLGEWTPNQSLVCAAYRSPPERGKAVDERGNGCLYRAEIDRIAFVDRFTGRVLKERRPPPASDMVPARVRRMLSPEQVTMIDKRCSTETTEQKKCVSAALFELVHLRDVQLVDASTASSYWEAPKPQSAER